MANPQATTLRSVRLHTKRMNEARESRDRAILAARNEGATLTVIADAAGLTHPGVKKIIDRSLAT